MTWFIALLFASSVLELVAARLKAAARTALAVSLMAVVAIISVGLIVLRADLYFALIGYFSLFRIINLVRLIDRRKQVDYLKSAASRSTLVLAAFQAAILLASYLISQLSISYRTQWTIAVLAALAAAVIIGLSLRRALDKTRPKVADMFVASSQLPTLTVAIPARNETDDLEACLNSLIDSDYPKLEILVLDDCSQEKRTPEIIRQFAQHGVRFVEGKEPFESWTAKNFAYEQLYAESNGQLIVFCGVDILFSRQTLSQMVELMLKKRKSMISFMPLNILPSDHFKALFIQPLRYLWEMGLLRRSFKRPPVLSSCWLIDRQSLEKNGSFKAVSRTIVPERYFARQQVRQNDGYSFVCLGAALGLKSNKNISAQLGTAIRTRYPLLRQRLENSALVSLVEAFVFDVPIIVLIYQLFRGNLLLAVLSGVNCLLVAGIILTITKLTYGQRLLPSLVLWPLVFAYDIALGFYSLWRYEFSQVIWKGRNVCVPVMLIQSKDSTSNSGPRS